MQMRKLIFLIPLLLSLQLMAQTDQVTETPEEPVQYWKKGGLAGFTFSQVTLHNWAAGGDNSISGNIILNAYANYNKASVSWENNFDIGYGLLKQNEDIARKTDDRIEFTSKYGRKINDKLFYSGLLNFRTQMTPGYDYKTEPHSLISDVFAPAYVTIALGVDYKPNEDFTLLFAPITNKTTIVMDTSLVQAFGVDLGENVRYEAGGFVRAAWKVDIMENVRMQTKMEFFSNYLENPENVDLNWEVLIVMKINKYLSANFSVQTIYDDDTKFLTESGTRVAKLQFKEIFGLGLNYKF